MVYLNNAFGGGDKLRLQPLHIRTCLGIAADFQALLCVAQQVVHLLVVYLNVLGLWEIHRNYTDAGCDKGGGSEFG